MKSYVVLISGRGSNLRALLDAKLPGRCVAVISNRATAAGLEVARVRGIDTVVVEHKLYADRETFDAALAAEVERRQPDLVVLAGFMRILGDEFVRRLSGRLMNIHPSLLPAFAGVATHARALAAGVRIHGCTVHFVTPSLDAGPIVIQAAVPVQSDDTELTLAARVLAQEHIILPRAARWFLDDRLHFGSGGQVYIDDEQRAEAALIVPAYR